MKSERLTIFLLSILTVTVTACLQQKQENHHLDEVLWTAAWSPDGSTIVMGGDQDSLRFFSGAKLELTQNQPIPGTVTQLKWHPTEELLAIGIQISDQKPGVLNLETGEITGLKGVSEAGARAIGWNHDGSLLAVGDLDAILHIFDNTGKVLRTVDMEQKGLTGLSWHPEKNLIALVGEFITLYDYASGSIKAIPSRTEEVLMLSVAWHPSGEFFVTGDYGDNVKDYPPLLQFWNSDGKKIRSTDLSKGEYRNICWSKDGNFLATASDALRIWTKEGELLHTGVSENYLWGIDWSPDDQRIVTSDINGHAFVWSREAQIIQELIY
ncbi:MAG: WD40 repeat domain-containing protein [Roseivirga sp.]|nr:WD40 repeat domain-containing protein [Roseivirga sp.]